jgi:hypothetical protein
VRHDRGVDELAAAFALLGRERGGAHGLRGFGLGAQRVEPAEPRQVLHPRGRPREEKRRRHRDRRRGRRAQRRDRPRKMIRGQARGIARKP